MPTLSSSAMTILADTCLPESLCKELWKDWEKANCGETGLILIGEKFYYSNSGKWITITEKEYNEQYRTNVKFKE